MLKIYDGEVFMIDLETFHSDSKRTLENIMENPDYHKMVFLLKKAGKIIAAANLKNFLKTNLIFKMFSDIMGQTVRKPSIT